ncbi:metalloregulator ArsR/SmtB family transcription factor [Clostridium estertheticum]|uniref:ArsR/SmtB family transcription factor n=1 Tax=Clostridium estertheticum TaxID=238834 RepID=UPI001C0DBDA7|nr:metalloregulator ArsR/SmtB family transcription factor [Clostridium estertheticum]MBU3216569.1 metalloregulator ArsR/SmtB family transcription factor [Clostridium estertheticum]WAG54507.1 metalloregulator ArsR/SmtB family transcription factor [Clostridium estertheticum]
MAHYNLPHDHGQNIDKILDKMPQIEQFQEVATSFQQLGDGTRLRILWLLCHSEECVSNIAATMRMSDPAVSHHLRILRNNGLIVSRRAGKEVYYKLSDNERANLLHKTMDTMFEISCPTDI